MISSYLNPIPTAIDQFNADCKTISKQDIPWISKATQIILKAKDLRDISSFQQTDLYQNISRGVDNPQSEAIQRIISRMLTGDVSPYDQTDALLDYLLENKSTDNFEFFEKTLPTVHPADFKSYLNQLKLETVFLDFYKNGISLEKLTPLVQTYLISDNAASFLYRTKSSSNKIRKDPADLNQNLKRICDKPDSKLDWDCKAVEILLTCKDFETIQEFESSSLFIPPISEKNETEMEPIKKLCYKMLEFKRNDFHRKEVILDFMLEKKMTYADKHLSYFIEVCSGSRRSIYKHEAPIQNKIETYLSELRSRGLRFEHIIRFLQTSLTNKSNVVSLMKTGSISDISLFFKPTYDMYTPVAQTDIEIYLPLFAKNFPTKEFLQLLDAHKNIQAEALAKAFYSCLLGMQKLPVDKVDTLTSSEKVNLIKKFVENVPSNLLIPLIPYLDLHQDDLIVVAESIEKINKSESTFIDLASGYYNRTDFNINPVVKNNCECLLYECAKRHPKTLIQAQLSVENWGQINSQTLTLMVDICLIEFFKSSLKPNRMTSSQRLELLKKLCQLYPFNVSGWLSFLDIESEAGRIDLARIWVEHISDLGVFEASNLKAFTITDRKVLMELVKVRCEKTHGGILIDYYRELEFNDSELKEIALFNASVPGNNYSDFGIRDIPTLFTIAKLSVGRERSLYGLANSRFALDLFNDDQLLDLAMTNLQVNGCNDLSYIVSNISDELIRIKILKIAATEDGLLIAKQMSGYQIFDPKERFNIAKLCALNNAGMGEYISYFDLSAEEENEIIRLSSQGDLLALATVINNFRKADRDASVLATKYASTSGALIDVLSNFHLRDSEHVISLLDIFLSVNNSSDYDNFECYKTYFYDVIAERALDLKYFMFNPSDTLAPYLDPKLSRLLSELLVNKDASENPEKIKILLEEYFKKPFSPHQKKDSLLSLAAFYTFVGQLEPDAQKWIDDQKFVHDIVSLRKPILRPVLLLALINVAKNPEARARFLRLQTPTAKPAPVRDVVNKKEKTLDDSADFKLISLILSQFDDETIPLLTLKAYSDKFHIKALSNDAQKMIKLLSALNRLYTCKAILPNPEQMLAKLTSGKDDKPASVRQICTNAVLFETILNLRLDKSLFHKDSLEKILNAAIQTIIPVTTKNPFSDTFEDTLYKFRQFELIPAYAGLLNQLTLGEKVAVSRAFSTFVSSVLDNDFLEMRKSSTNNPHLKFLEGPNGAPQRLQAWHDYKLDFSLTVESPLSQEAKAASAAAVSDSPKSSFFDTLVDKIVTHHHLDRAEIPELVKYFADPSQKEAILSELNSKMDNPYAQLQIYTLSLAEGNKKVLPDLLVYLESLRNTVTGLENYITDIRGFIAQENQPKLANFNGYKLSLSEDPCDYFLMGTEVPGSCQSVHAAVSTNKCLMGYALNGADRLLVIKDSSGKIVARTVLRLLWDEVDKKPVLFQERIYSLKIKELDDLILQEAKIFAEKVGVDYASDDSRHPHPLHSYGGQAPFEYSDAAGGVTNGKFII